MWLLFTVKRELNYLITLLICFKVVKSNRENEFCYSILSIKNVLAFVKMVIQILLSLIDLNKSLITYSV